MKFSIYGSIKTSLPWLTMFQKSMFADRFSFSLTFYLFPHYISVIFLEFMIHEMISYEQTVQPQSSADTVNLTYLSGVKL